MVLPAPVGLELGELLGLGALVGVGDSGRGCPESGPAVGEEVMLLSVSVRRAGLASSFVDLFGRVWTCADCPLITRGR